MPGGTLRPHNGGITVRRRRRSCLASSGLSATSVGAIEHDGAMMEFDVNEASV